MNIAKSITKGVARYGVKKYAPTVATKIVAAVGTRASTGTAISTLSGAAATSSAMAVIGTPISAALGAVGISVAPAVAGATAVGFAAGFVVNKLVDIIFD